MKMRVQVKVPATSANLGAGFDCFGIALSLHNTFAVDEILSVGEYRVEVSGEGAGEIGGENNFFIESYEAALREWGIEPPGLSLKMKNEIPMKRGLGSSSAAIVGGVMAANALRQNYGKIPLEKSELLKIMTKQEGHPDNVVPCCLGGFVVSSWSGGELKFVKLPKMDESLRAVLIVPERGLETSEARRALPQNVKMEDAVFNIGRAALFVASWTAGAGEFGNFGFAMEDRLHQPYRAELIPGAQKILDAAKKIDGCLGAGISGAGSGMIAICREECAENVGELLQKKFSDEGSESRVLILQEDRNGATIEP